MFCSNGVCAPVGGVPAYASGLDTNADGLISMNEAGVASAGLDDNDGWTPVGTTTGFPMGVGYPAGMAGMAGVGLGAIPVVPGTLGDTNLDGFVSPNEQMGGIDAPGILGLPAVGGVPVAVGMNPMNTCQGQIFHSGTKEVDVDCPTKIPYQEKYNVPRTVYSTRPETRHYTAQVPVPKQVPYRTWRTETKLVTQTRQVPVSRQVPVDGVRTVMTSVPVQRDYTVHVPVQSTVNEERVMTKFRDGTKKCKVQVPVYNARCAAADTLPVTFGLPTMGQPLVNNGMVPIPTAMDTNADGMVSVNEQMGGVDAPVVIG